MRSYNNSNQCSFSGLANGDTAKTNAYSFTEIYNLQKNRLNMKF